jgi:RluA family pseudouridine synthase
MRNWYESLHKRTPVIYEDDHIVVLSKPAGILSHPNPQESKSSQALFLAPYDMTSESYILLPSNVEDQTKRIFLAHRLDRETSGIMVACFSSQIAKKLRKQFAEKTIKKEYRALLIGVPSPATGRWSHRLEKNAASSGVRVVRGVPDAHTTYRVLETYRPPGLALVALFPETGRMHQLRVQTAKRGFPIAGDRKYGNFADNKVLTKELGLRRMFLHAYRIEFEHPVTGRALDPIASLPDDLSRALSALSDRKPSASLHAHFGPK